jgi:hypothetical protein
MIKCLDLILNGKGGVGKISDCLVQHLGQPLKTAVGRLVLCKPFLATAAVWLDSAGRRCELRLRFCVRKTCPAAGTRQPSMTHRQASSGDKSRIELDKQVLDNCCGGGRRKSKPPSMRTSASGGSPGMIWFSAPVSTTLPNSCYAAKTVTAPASPTRRSAPFVRSNPRCKVLRSARGGWKPTSRIRKTVGRTGGQGSCPFEKDECVDNSEKQTETKSNKPSRNAAIQF